jgi:phosphoribosyl-AMP cyclohydrolase
MNEVRPIIDSEQQGDLFQALEAMPAGFSLPSALLLANLRWNEQGLIPVVAQDAHNQTVLMVAWMNREALAVTLREQRMCYWSRSRQQLWRKGETSGHQQQLRALRIDCDGDCLLCLVEQTGPACHTGRPNCFYWQVVGDTADIISTRHAG